MIRFAFHTPADSGEWAANHPDARPALVGERVEFRPATSQPGAPVPIYPIAVELLETPKGSNAELVDIIGGAALTIDARGPFKLRVTAKGMDLGSMVVTIFGCDPECLDHVPEEGVTDRRLRQLLCNALPSLLASSGGFDGTPRTMNGVNWPSFGCKHHATPRAKRGKAQPTTSGATVVKQ